MRSLSPAVVSALEAVHVTLVTFVKLDFPGGTVALNTSTLNLVHAGVTYLGAYGIGAIAPVSDHPGELPGIQLQLTRVDSSMVALALDEGHEVQGSLVTISTAVLDSQTYQILDVVTNWVGYADCMSISEDGDKAVVSLSCESKGVDLINGNPRVYNDADQQAEYPGDRAFEYVVEQSDKPVVWPHRSWFYK
jgi:hypothetical protein